MWALGQRVLDLLYPPRCPGCETRGEGVGFCPRCAAEAPPVRSPMCSACGVPFAGAGADHLCSRCLTRRPQFDMARSCAVYRSTGDTGSTLAAALHRYKYHRDVTLAPVLGDLLAERCPLPPQYDLVLPVPLHLSRLRWRGFNQSLLLARPLARRFGLPLDPFVLLRTRATRPQVHLDETDRRRNITGAFAVRDRGAVRGRRILLVDDVYTTGATVDECARTLRRAGARHIDVLVLARAVLQ